MNNFYDFNNFAIGTDIESIARFEKYAVDKSLAKKLKVFTDKELDYCFRAHQPAPHLAARFCAKEAVYKAFCALNNVDIPSFNEIEILNDKKGVPHVNITVDTFKNFNCKITLSHNKDNAVAFVVLLKNK